MLNKQTDFVLSAGHLTYRYPGREQAAISHLSFRLKAGEYLSLLGPNGSGKSTLLDLVAGLKVAEKGQVRLQDQVLASLSIPEKARRIAMVQQRASIGLGFTVWESLLLGLSPQQGRCSKLRREEADFCHELAERCGLSAFLQRRLNELSGGERQRVAICRALVQQSSLLLLDEAMSELDLAAKLEINELLREICQQRQLAILAVHHDLQLAWRVSDRVLVLQDGLLQAEGTPAQALTPAIFRTVFKVEVDIEAEKGFYIKGRVYDKE